MSPMPFIRPNTAIRMSLSARAVLAAHAQSVNAVFERGALPVLGDNHRFLSRLQDHVGRVLDAVDSLVRRQPAPVPVLRHDRQGLDVGQQQRQLVLLQCLDDAETGAVQQHHHENAVIALVVELPRYALDVLARLCRAREINVSDIGKGGDHLPCPRLLVPRDFRLFLVVQARA